MQYATRYTPRALAVLIGVGLFSAQVVAQNSVDCELTVNSQWGNGYQATATVTNPGEQTVSAWAVPIDLPEGHSIATLWSGQYDASAAQVSSFSWNGQLAPGASTQFGFIGQFQGAFEAPQCGALSPEPAPEPSLDVAVTVKGRTVLVELITEGIEDVDSLQPSIEFDKFKRIEAPSAWHTFLWDDEFLITVSLVGDGLDLTATQTVTVSERQAENRPPNSYLYLTSTDGVGRNYSGLSYDPDDDPLEITEKVYTTPLETGGRSDYVVLTTFDGELGDTIGRSVYRAPGAFFDDMPNPAYSFRVEGQALTVNAQASSNVIEIDWDFGDQSEPVDATYHTHVYEQPGRYDVTLYGIGYPNRRWVTRTINIGNGLNNPPLVGVRCWERTIDSEEYWVDCYPLGTLDPDGDPLDLTWTMGDGTEYTTNTVAQPVRHRYTESGPHYVNLSVTDGEVELDVSTSVTAHNPHVE